jgi:hypothetical protein
MHLVKSWLTNKNVIICNSTLSEINNFALTVNGPGNVQEVATEVVHLIPDKVRGLLQVPVDESQSIE